MKETIKSKYWVPGNILITNRNDYYIVVSSEVAVSKLGFMNASAYNEDLTCNSDGFTIKAVYKFSDTPGFGISAIDDLIKNGIRDDNQVIMIWSRMPMNIYKLACDLQKAIQSSVFESNNNIDFNSSFLELCSAIQKNIKQLKKYC